jgi:hypothetical protein
MESAHEEIPAERHLQEMLDALEAGLLHLRRERDELREALKPGKTATAKKSAGRKATKKATKKAAKKAKKAPRKAVAPPVAEPEPKPKASLKPRMALGRTLTQIRAPRNPV